MYKDKLITVPFFEKCLSIGMKESKTDVIELPEENIGDFNLFIDWIYAERVEVINGDAAFGDALDAWLTAQKYSMAEWQNELVDAMHTYFRNYHLQLALAVWVVDQCEKDSLLYKLVLDQFAYELATNFDYYERRKEEVNVLVEKAGISATDMVGFAVKEKKRPGRFPCSYHVHPDGNRCV